MRKQLTDLSIEKLRLPTTGRLEIFDTIVPSMAVRVTPNGAKTFVVRARVKGQPDPIRVTLGDARGMKLKKARQEASDVLKVCRAGDEAPTRSPAVSSYGRTVESDARGSRRG